MLSCSSSILIGGVADEPTNPRRNGARRVHLGAFVDREQRDEVFRLAARSDEVAAERFLPLLADEGK